MKTTVKKTEKGFSVEFVGENFNSFVDGLTEDELKELNNQIGKALNKPKAVTRVWNPRSNRHEIVED